MRFDLALFDDAGPFDHFCLDVFGERGRIHDDGAGAFALELRLHFGRFQCRLHGRIQLCGHRRGQAGGRRDAPPVVRDIAGHAGFRDGRHVRQDAAALGAAGAQGPQLPGLDEGRRLHQRREHDLHVAGDHVLHRRTAAFVRHVGEVDAGRQLEQFGAEVLEAADAGRGVVQFSRVRLGERKQVLHRLDRRLRIDHQYVRPGGENRNRREGFDRIVFERVQRRVDRMRDRDDAQRIAVGRRHGAGFRAEGGAAAAAVFDVDLLAELRAEMLRDQAADHVVAAARRERDDQPYRSGRIIVGAGRRGERQQHCGGLRETGQKIRHCFPLPSCDVSSSWTYSNSSRARPPVLSASKAENRCSSVRP